MPQTFTGTLRFEVTLDTPDDEEHEQAQEQQPQEHPGLGGVGAAEGPKQD